MKKITLIILGCLTIVSVGTYLLISNSYFRIGFPLDDAWIHQTYARSIASTGEWAFNPGQISGGSTSPLWTMILSVGYLFKIPLFIWTFGLGTFILWITAILAELLIRQQVGSYRSIFPWVGGIVIFEWHLVWAAVSGMETLLFSVLVLGFFYHLLKKDPEYLKIGVLIGIGVWLRPDAITLIGPACLVAALEDLPARQKIMNILKISLGFLSLFSLYLPLMVSISGSPWPTTFYAKQAEYATIPNLSLLQKFGKLSLQFIIGVGVLLLPGYVMTIVNASVKRNWKILATFFWVVGMVGLYAWRLSESYQHGRYLIPSMLVYFTFGLIGVINIFIVPNIGWRWSLGVTWKISICLVLLSFWGYGAYAYARDVAYIESEMVDTARWVAQNIPEHDIIASHDIGALGYYGGHTIVDLAGLISPEVIPFINNEGALKKFMDSNQVDYLVTFPGWYPKLINGLSVVYRSQGKISPMLGGENLVVYKWSDPPR